jgi:hypothetical protein
MRLKQPVRGIHIGTCVDGSAFADNEAAHAHISGCAHRGYICARSKKDLAQFLLHELAHMAADSAHNEDWRRSMRGLGARIPAAHRKKSKGAK